MTPMKKKDLKYAMRTAINLSEFATRMRELVFTMTRDVEEGIDLAGMKDAEVSGFPISGDMEDLRIAYDHFLEETLASRNRIEELYSQEG